MSHPLFEPPRSARPPRGTRPMKIVIPDDYQDCVRTLEAFARLEGHEVTVFNDTVTDLDTLSARFRDAEALVLIRERTPITAELLARLPNLRVISQTGGDRRALADQDRKSTRLNSSHVRISYAVFCLKKKKKNKRN